MINVKMTSSDEAAFFIVRTSLMTRLTPRKSQMMAPVGRITMAAAASERESRK